MSDLNKSNKNYTFLEIAGEKGYPLYYRMPGVAAFKVLSSEELAMIGIEKREHFTSYRYERRRYTPEQIAELLQGLELCREYDFVQVAKAYVEMTGKIEKLIC